MNTTEIADAIWQKIEPDVFISRREFMDGLEGWDVVAREVDGEIVGATLTHGPEFHFITFGEKKYFTRAVMTDCVQHIIDKHGFVITRTPKDDSRQRRFNLAVGFEIESEDEFFTHFRMEKLKLHGVNPCPS